MSALAAPPRPPERGKVRFRRARALLDRRGAVLDWPRSWACAHRQSLIALGTALALVTGATAWNLQGWPGRVDEDEGTYVAEAWAMISAHHLSHYTYWYDHPPLGWAQLAAYIWLTGGLARYPSAVGAGREFMLLVTAASCVLLYVLCRRLKFRRTAAAVTVIAFGLSPLAVYYHRLVSLDNIGTLWLLVAMVIAASRRRSLGTVFWSGVCSAVAVLSKETVALLVPAVFWIIWQQTPRQTRKWQLAIYVTTFALCTAYYPLFALLRGEFFPGRGHVSLLWSVWWQVMERPGSGFIFSPGTAANALLTLWLETDRWLLLAGVALVPVGLAVRRLRPFAVALLIQLLMAMTGGYLPYFYVTAALPFAALLIGGVADTLWEPARSALAENASRFCVLTAGVVALLLVAPRWGSALVRQAGVNGTARSLAATAWVERHVPRHDVVVVDDYFWLDLKRAGLNPLWTQKTASNAESQGELPDGWRSISYIVVTGQVIGVRVQVSPLLRQAIRHSVPVAEFGGGLVVRRVIAGRAPGARAKGPDWNDAARHRGRRGR